MEPTNNPQSSTNPASGQGVAPVGTPMVAQVGAPVEATTPTAPTAVPGTGTGNLGAPTTPAPAPAPEPGVAGADATAMPTAAVDQPGAPTASAAPVDTRATPAAPVVGAGTGATQSGGFEGLSMTEPIMQPDLPAAPDPVKQELESPMKAAGPVPGSIGSAMSVTQDGTQLDANGQPIVVENAGQSGAGGTVANVAFNDPAKQPDGQAQPGAENAKGLKKPIKLDFKKFNLKNINRTTLVIFIVVAVMIVIVLATVLVVQLMS